MCQIEPRAQPIRPIHQTPNATLDTDEDIRDAHRTHEDVSDAVQGSSAADDINQEHIFTQQGDTHQKDDIIKDIRESKVLLYTNTWSLHAIDCRLDLQFRKCGMLRFIWLAIVCLTEGSVFIFVFKLLTLMKEDCLSNGVLGGTVVNNMPYGMEAFISCRKLILLANGVLGGSLVNIMPYAVCHEEFKA
ncbi:hypothetical protein PoB_007365400 [Plakobranchus ocellatus]|uniref:Uncharacterized protein n=1 Tax=Plakobranchus ocellatus TaxID=259542 RepID=A0AAV4DSJ6_9GAST|nr:hypothetical protein PoB_007365400 [Plakobranchus ocellatus]